VLGVRLGSAEVDGHTARSLDTFRQGESLLNSNDAALSFSRTLANGTGRMMASARFRGKARLANYVGGIACRFMPEVDCQPVPGARVTVTLSDRIGRMMWAGCYEPELVELLKQVLDPAMTFVDIGAQVGYFSTAAAALVGPAGAVYSFEPDPGCFSMLQRNAQPYPWMKVHNSAVADFTGEASFYRSPKHDESGWGAIFDAGGGRAKIDVRVCTLDSWRAGEGVRQIDVIKIDVEGAECRVLEGARDVIAGARPLVWVEANEVCLGRDGQSVSLLLGLLARRDYVAHRLYQRRSQAFENIVAIPRERSDLFERIGRSRIGLRAMTSDAANGNHAAV
jgi:FkbM family methyltransferase